MTLHNLTRYQLHTSPSLELDLEPLGVGPWLLSFHKHLYEIINLFSTWINDAASQKLFIFQINLFPLLSIVHKWNQVAPIQCPNQSTGKTQHLVLKWNWGKSCHVYTTIWQNNVVNHLAQVSVNRLIFTHKREIQRKISLFSPVEKLGLKYVLQSHEIKEKHKISTTGP